MALQPIPLASETVDRRPDSVERLINCFVEQRPKQGSRSSQFTIRGHAGLSTFATVGSGPIRGLVEHKGYIYAVSGTAVYQIDSVGNAVLMAGTVLGSAPVQMAEGYDHVVIAADTRSYVIDTSGVSPALIEMNPVYWGLQAVEWMDGRWFYLFPDRDDWELSDLDDPYNSDDLGFVAAEAYPDRIVGLKRSGSELYVFGEASTEYWRSSGSAVPTMDRVGFFEVGCLSNRCITRHETTIVWITADKTVMAMQGFQPQKISTPSIDEKLRKATGTLSIFSYVDRGHPFIVVNSDAEPALLYDLSTGSWSERKSHNLAYWNVGAQCSAWNKHFIASAATGVIGCVDGDTHTDVGGLALRREATLPPVTMDEQRVRHFALEVTSEVGQGATNLLMDYSDDGGYTWSSERPAYTGPAFAYGKRSIWRRLGQARHRSYRIAQAEASPFTLMSARVDVA